MMIFESFYKKSAGQLIGFPSPTKHFYDGADA